MPACLPQDMAAEINDAMGRSYAVPDDVDESDLMAELDALEADLAVEDAGKEGPSYLQVGACLLGGLCIKGSRV